MAVQYISRRDNELKDLKSPAMPFGRTQVHLGMGLNREEYIFPGISGESPMDNNAAGEAIRPFSRWKEEG